MNRLATWACVGVVLTAAAAWADAPPPVRSDPISLDRNSPSVTVFGNTPADIYGENPPGLVIGFGWDVGGPGPIMHVLAPNYGLTNMVLPGDNNDAHSNGETSPFAPQFFFFSGDLASTGMAFTAYNNQFNRNQACGDRFVANGPTAASPVQVMMTGVPTFIAGPVFPGPINLLSANQTRFNEIPSIPPPLFNFNWQPDNMDALELTLMDLNRDNMHETPIYFSLDPMSPSLAAGFSPADILFSPPGAPAFFLFAPAPALGLSMVAAGDDVDALAVWDLGGMGVMDPGIDYALFSLTPGSPYLNGPDGVPGTPDDYSAADIFVTDFTGINFLFLPANTFGMQFADNVDGIDVEIWRPDLFPQVLDWWTQMVNIDIWLPPWWPPPFPNDFDIILNGIHPEQIGELYVEDFPEAFVVGTPEGSQIVWWGREVPPGMSVHVGLVITDDTMPNRAQIFWTWNGNPIFTLPDLWQRWYWVQSIGGYVVIWDLVENRSSEPVWIQRRFNTSLVPVELEDLQVGDELWNTAWLVDPVPMLMMPGQTESFGWEYDDDTRGYVMMYDVYRDDGSGQPGEYLMTYLNATTTIEWAGRIGDMNCDGLVNAGDIPGFVTALVGTPPYYPEYYDQYPNCNRNLADCDENGRVNAGDIPAFIELLIGP